MTENIRSEKELYSLIRLLDDTPELPVPVNTIDWRRLTDLAVHHKLAPLLYRSLETLEEGIVPDGVLGRLKGLYMANAARNTYISGLLVSIVDQLDALGILAVPFKGPVLSEFLYGDIDSRVFSDIDILISPDDALRSIEILESSGWRLMFPLSDQQRKTSVKVLSCLTLYDEAYSLSVDLQWGLLKESFRDEYGMKDIKDRLEPARFFGSDIHTLSKEDSLFFLCFHGMRHHWDSLEQIYSIHVLLRNQDSFDWDYIIGLASDRRLLRVMLIGLALSSELFDSPLPGQIQELAVRDKTISTLVDEIINAQLLQRKLLNENQFSVDCRESLIDKMIYYLNPVFKPQLTDITAIPLPEKFSDLYYLFRPFLLTIKYLS